MDAGAVRFGLVGYGFGGRYFHAPLLAAARGRRLPRRGDHVAGAAGAGGPGAPVGGVRVDSLEALVEAGAEAVAISTPADTHSPLTDRALDLGLAVVCDKPFAMDAAAAQASVDRAAAAGLALSPYQNRRWDSDFLHAAPTGRRRVAGRGAHARVPLRADERRRRPGCGRRRHPARLRQPPGRPGAGAAGPGQLGVRPVVAAGSPVWTTTCWWSWTTRAGRGRCWVAAGARARRGRGSG